MILFIEYPKCSTCIKAKHFLEDYQKEFIDRHIVEQKPNKEELKKWHELSGLDLNKLFNTSGLVYKDLKLKDKIQSMSDEEKYELLSTNGMLVKRPILVLDNIVLFGFNSEKWAFYLK